MFVIITNYHDSHRHHYCHSHFIIISSIPNSGCCIKHVLFIALSTLLFLSGSLQYLNLCSGHLYLDAKNHGLQ